MGKDTIRIGEWEVIRSNRFSPIYHRHTDLNLWSVHEGGCWQCGAEPPAAVKWMAATRKIAAAR